ncbi:MAG: hypothetical protein OHK0039_42470 [Bacteroidia bacterium]
MQTYDFPAAGRYVLAIALLVAGFGLRAQTSYTTVKSGNWNDSTVWSVPGIPGPDDDVRVSAGDTLTLNGGTYACKQLFVDADAVLMPTNSSLTVNGDFTTKGLYHDTKSAGRMRFKGAAFVDRSGGWISTGSDSSTLVFEGSLIHRGDTMILNGCRFASNNQFIDGRTRIYANGTFWIDSGLVVTMINPLGIEFRNKGPQGLHASSTFVNQKRVTFRGGTTPMETGRVDFSFTGNEVIYEGYVAQGVKTGTYYNLTILPDSARSEAQRIASGNITVLNKLLIDPKALLYLKGDTLRVQGTATVEGAVYSDRAESMAIFEDLTVIAGRFDGVNNKYFRVQVNDDLLIPSKNPQFNNVRLCVADSTIIPGGRVLIIGGLGGEHSFGFLGIEEGGRFFAKTTSANYTFRGPVLADGEIQLKDGLYVFQDTLTLLDSASIRGTSAASTVVFKKPVVCHGGFPANLGLFVFHDDLLGSLPINIAGSMIVASGRTIHNRNAGGLILLGTLDGQDASAGFVNETLLVLASENNVAQPMQTGSLDACSVPGNTIAFASTQKNQQITAGCYRNLVVEGNVKVMIGGEINVYEHLTLSAIISNDPSPLILSKVRLVGDADQYIEGNGTGAIVTLAIDKPAGRVVSFADFAVLELLIMSQGVLVADPGILVLGNSGQLLETPESYVLGRVATRRSVNAGGGREFGGLGLKIKASPDQSLGETLVIRTTGQAVEPGQIERSFEIIPTNNTNLNAKVEFTYSDHDLLGAVEADLVLEHRSGGSEAFSVPAVFVVLPDTNMITASEIQSFGVLSARPSSLAVNVYPSPVTGDAFTLSYVLSQAETVNIRVFDRSGKTFYQGVESGQPGTNEVRVASADLTAGTYFVRIKAGKRKGYRKFLRY